MRSGKIYVEFVTPEGEAFTERTEVLNVEWIMKKGRELGLKRAFVWADSDYWYNTVDLGFFDFVEKKHVNMTWKEFKAKYLSST